MKTRIFSLLLSSLLFYACDSTGNEQSEVDKKDALKEGLIKQFYNSGALRSAINYKKGEKHGLATTYYESGKPKLKLDYVNNKKHGTAKTYYESGQLFQETQYVNGVMHGLRKKYRQNGQLMAEIPYYNGSVCTGLKEYLLNGKLKTKYPTIIIEEIDQLAGQNKFVIKIRLSNNAKSAKVFFGKLSEEGCLNDGLLSLSALKPGEFEIAYNLQPGMFIMEELHFVAQTKTTLGNPYIIQKSHNLAIENRAY